MDDVLSNLDLWLIPADKNSTDDAVAFSFGVDDSVEHIFFEVPEGGGEYKILVTDSGAASSASDGPPLALDAQTDFAVAWWTYEPTSLLPGDYDRNGVVDLADRTVWVQNYGATVFAGRTADGNLDGVVDAADYTVWRDAFVVAIAVPEPGAITILACVASLVVPHARPN